MRRMKKAELLAAVPERLPESCTARILNTSGGRALMVALPYWEKSVTMHKWMGPSRGMKGIVHFCWKDGWLTYYPELKWWTKESLGWTEFHSCLTGSDMDEEGARAIREFTGMIGGLYDVEHYEDRVRARRERKSLDRKQARINALMGKVDALPKGFRQWCERKLAAAGGKKACIKLFQRLGDAAIERMFTVEECMDGISFTEICRAFTDGFGTPWLDWYYGERRNRAGARQEFWDSRSGSIVSALPNRYFVYGRNLEEIGLGRAECSVVRALDGKADPAMVLFWLRKFPEAELPVKAGLHRYVLECMAGIDPGTKLARLKCLPAPQRKRLAENDGGIGAWKLLVVCPKLTDRNLKEVCRIHSGIKLGKIMDIADKGLNMNHVLNLLRETGGIKVPVLQKYWDYLQMAEARGSNVREEVIYRNRRWEHFHDQYVEERRLEEERQERKRNRAKWAKWKGITKDWKRNKRIFAWEGDGYVVLVPKTPEEINEEGRRQHHCVGAQDEYKTKMAARKSYILFLRHKEKPEEPYYTIEATEQRVLQAYGAYDRKPDWTEVDGVLKDWMKQVRKNASREKGLAEKIER